MTKKLMSWALSLMMCMSFAIPAMATEPERIEIVVNSEEDILEFYNSPQYVPNELYSFIMENPKAVRALCPNCGNNTYTGKTKTENISIQKFYCITTPTYEDTDRVDVMGVYAYTSCSRCGEIAGQAYPSEIYYMVDCINGTTFRAKDGYTAPPYDIHCVKSNWPVKRDWPPKVW